MEGKSQNSLIGLVLTLILSYVYREFISTVDGPIVEISTGKVQSIVSKARNGMSYYEFLAIPYAQPPVGDLRFEPPRSAKPWKGIRKETKFGPECIQLEVMVTGKLVGEENCLYLNVFTPKIEKSPSKLLPVMVFVHGGLFMAGSANMYRAKYFMETQDVILVTLNYRLGSLGFLNTGDETVRGNMGLKDQRLALVWVKNNIKAFGGDPARVTLFGESAGGASVHFHILSKASSGLFHKALSQSGTALKPWALSSDPSRQAYNFGKKFNCPSNSSQELVSCLRGIDAKKLVQVHLAVMSAIKRPLDTFAPTVETVITGDTFLSEDPYILEKSGNFNKVTWMTGVNKGEGLLNLGRIISDSDLASRIGRDWNKIAPTLLSYDMKNQEASEEIRAYYFGNTVQNPLSSMENFTQLLSDRNFFQGTHKASIFHSKVAPVYLYYFTYPGDVSLFKLFKWISPHVFLPVELQVVIELVKEFVYKYLFGVVDQNYGPCHADELALLFNMHYFAEVTKSSRDYEMSRSLIKLWTSYAKDDTMSYQNIHWDPVTATSNQTSLKYLQLDETGKIIDEPFTNRLKFWDTLKL